MQILSHEQIEVLKGIIAQNESVPEIIPPLLEIWDAWVESLDLPSQTRADHYEN